MQDAADSTGGLTPWLYFKSFVVDGQSDCGNNDDNHNKRQSESDDDRVSMMESAIDPLRGYYVYRCHYSSPGEYAVRIALIRSRTSRQNLVCKIVSALFVLFCRY